MKDADIARAIRYEPALTVAGISEKVGSRVPSFRVTTMVARGLLRPVSDGGEWCYRLTDRGRELADQ